MKKIIILLYVGLISFAGFSQEETQKDSINQMDEVLIEGKNKLFTFKNGSIKIDVANSIYKSVPNPLDLLSKLPKVILSADRESISIIGKGEPLLYIDNQKVGMNDLNALSVDDIKSVEIITNPSSKYEAEGRAVILITRKRSRKEGFQIVASETTSFKKRFNNFLGLYSSVKLKKTEFKANFNYNHLNPWESNGSDYSIPDNNMASNYLVAGYTKRNRYIFGTSVFHQINSDDYVSFNVNGNFQADDFDFKTKTYSRQNVEENRINTLGNTIADKNFLNLFFNYNKKFQDIDAVLFTGFQYSKFNEDSDANSLNNYNEAGFSPFQASDEDFKVNLFSGRIDFEKKFKNEMKLEIGGLYSSAEANTALAITNFELDSTSKSKYNLKEKNISGYTQLSGSIHKVSWNAGLRLENTNIRGRYDIASLTSIDKNYTNLFPKIEIGIPIDSTKTLSFNYSRAISRPDYSSTSQGITYINPYFAFSSNINLNPAISNEFSANFQYNDKSIKILYYENRNVMNYGFVYNEPENLLIYRPENFDKESGYNLELALPFKHKFWTSTNTFTAILNKIEDATAVVNSAKPYLYYYSNHTFDLKNDLTLSLTGWGLSRRSEGAFQRNAFFLMDIGASKTFFKNLSCTMSYNNIFRSTDFTESFEVNRIKSKAVFYGDNYEFTVAVKYTFGKLKDSIFKEKEMDENSSRIK